MKLEVPLRFGAFIPCLPIQFYFKVTLPPLIVILFHCESLSLVSYPMGSFDTIINRIVIYGPFMIRDLFMQVELGFGNSIVNDFFYVSGYDVRGFVVAQVSSPLGNNTQWFLQNFSVNILLSSITHTHTHIFHWIETIVIRTWVSLHAMMEELLLNPPFGEKDCFFRCAGVCAILWVLWGEWNSRIFRGVNRDPLEVWFLRFHVSL